VGRRGTGLRLGQCVHRAVTVAVPFELPCLEVLHVWQCRANVAVVVGQSGSAAFVQSECSGVGRRCVCVSVCRCCCSQRESRWADGGVTALQNHGLTDQQQSGVSTMRRRGQIDATIETI
jgi:hypothetical protein